MLNQGMRPEEVTSLAKADVDIERGELHVRRGKSKAAKRTLNLTTESKSILAHRIAKKFGPWIFPSKRKPGKPIARVNGQHDKVLSKAAKAGKPLNFVLYDLRHTFATRAAQAGVDLATLASILGRSGLRVVMKRPSHGGASQGRDAEGRAEHGDRGGQKAVKNLVRFLSEIEHQRGPIRGSEHHRTGVRFWR